MKYNILENQTERIASAVESYRTAMNVQLINATDRFMEGEVEISFLERAFDRQERCEKVIESVSMIVGRIISGDKNAVTLIADLRGTLEMMMDEVYEIRNLLV